MLQTRCQLGLRVAYGTDRHQFARSDHSGYPHGIRRRPEQVCVILIFASIRAGWVRSTGLLRLPPQSCQVVWTCFSAVVGGHDVAPVLLDRVFLDAVLPLVGVLVAIPGVAVFHEGLPISPVQPLAVLVGAAPSHRGRSS